MTKVVLPFTPVVIIDTETNKHMTGAKGQDIFSSKGAARRSLIHTGWWKTFQRENIVCLIGGKAILAQSKKVHDMLMKTGDQTLRRKLREELMELEQQIRELHSKYKRETGDFSSNLKVSFVNQTRYKLMKVLDMTVGDL